MRRRRPDFEGTGPNRTASVNAEGINATAKWRRLRAERDSALDEETIADLAERFGFAIEDLRRFAVDLAIALDPDHTPATAPLDLTKAAERARKTGTAMNDKLGRAMDLIDDVHVALDNLDADPLRHGTERTRLRALRDRMAGAHEALSELRAEARWIAENNAGALLEGTPSDQRGIADLRRRHVLDCIFSFWGRFKQRLTITTKFRTSERAGELIEFANAVIEQVTDPSVRLRGETIFRDLKKFKERQASSPSVSNGDEDS